MGAIAGAIMLPAIGAVLGLLGVFFISRAVFGRPRKPEKMQEFEVRTLFASLRLADPIALHLAEDAPAPSKDVLRVYSHEGLLPLCTSIGDRLIAPNNASETDTGCQSFKDTLALLPRWKLRRHHRRLSRRASKLARSRKATGVQGLLRSSSRSHSSA